MILESEKWHTSSKKGILSSKTWKKTNVIQLKRTFQEFFSEILLGILGDSLRDFSGNFTGIAPGIIAAKHPEMSPAIPFGFFFQWLIQGFLQNFFRVFLQNFLQRFIWEFLRGFLWEFVSEIESTEHGVCTRACILGAKFHLTYLFAWISLRNDKSYSFSLFHVHRRHSQVIPL